MSRRPLLHPIGRLAKAQNRMAPGGRVWSESPIPRKFSPRVPMVGDDTPAPGGPTCIDLVADPDGHTFRPAGGGAFGAPAHYFWGISLHLTQTVPAGQSLRYEMHDATGITNLYALDPEDGGPFTSGAVITWDGWPGGAAEPTPDWLFMRLGYGYSPGANWVTASGVRFCYSTTQPGATAAAVGIQELRGS